MVTVIQHTLFFDVHMASVEYKICIHNGIHVLLVCIYITGTVSCPYDTDFRCPQSGVCIRYYDVCDGYSQCNHGEDEQNCSMYIHTHN